jgi:hypothetical protein
MIDEEERQDLLQRLDEELDDSPKGKVAKEIVESLPTDDPKRPADAAE